MISESEVKTKKNAMANILFGDLLATGITCIILVLGLEESDSQPRHPCLPSTQPQGVTPLHLATFDGSVEIMKYLISSRLGSDADMDTRSKVSFRSDTPFWGGKHFFSS